MKQILFSCFLFIYACNAPSKKMADTFIIPADTIPVYKNTNKNGPPPPPPVSDAYYCPSNFIIDTGEQVFYYQQALKGFLNDDVVEWNRPPAFIDLAPKDLIRVSPESLSSFIQLNVIDAKSAQVPGPGMLFVGIASTKDCFTSAALAKMLSIFKDSPGHVQWKLRKVTQEEAVVLDYKKRKENYFPDAMSLDTTKIQFINGNSGFEKNPVDTLETLLKFYPKVTFKEYRVSKRFTGHPPATLDFSTCSYGMLYKTASRIAADCGAVFAGHYAFAQIGCGASCQLSIIIDIETGKVYAGPPAGSGYEYRVDSKLILANPPDSNETYYPTGYSTPQQYLWTENKLTRIY